MHTWTVEVETGCGSMPTYLAHGGDGAPKPAVIVYMDALGIRAELEAMARRVAAQGYYVMLPNLFYRDGGPSFDPGGLPQHIAPEMERLNVATTMAMVAGDTRALIEHASGDARADATAIGAIGFCMGGRHAVTAAAEFPDRVRTALSIHGGRLVTDASDSAHRRLREVVGELYFGFADNDPAAPAEHLAQIRDLLAQHEITGEAELLTGALHGFIFPERFCYHAGAAEHCWQRCFDMLARNLPVPRRDLNGEQVT